jgi:hypothetical protein
VNQRHPSALAEQREGEAPVRRGTEHRHVLDAAEPTKGKAPKLPVAHDVGSIKGAKARLLYSELIPSFRGHTRAMAGRVAGVTLSIPKQRRKTFLKLPTPVAHLLIHTQAGPEHNPLRVEQLGRPNPISDDGLLRKGPFRVASSARHRVIFRTQQSEILAGIYEASLVFASSVMPCQGFAVLRVAERALFLQFDARHFLQAISCFLPEARLC